MVKKLYMAVTRDELSLPLAVADSPAELAKLRGVKVDTVNSQIWLGKNRQKYPGYVRVEIEEEQE